MERKLCHECQGEGCCIYEKYIKETAGRITNFSSEEEKQEAMETIRYLRFRAGTKSDPCPKYSELESIGIPTVVLDKNQGQKPKSSAEQGSS